MKTLKLGLSLVALLYVQLVMADCPNANRQSNSSRHDSTNPTTVTTTAPVVRVADTTQGAK